MKNKILLIVVAVLVVVFVLWRTHQKQSPDQAASSKGIVSNTATPAHSTANMGERKQIIIQTGQERLANAARCMAYVADISMQLSNDHGSDKPMLMALGGFLFYHDALMSEMKNGYIMTTTNELRRDFSNALAQMFTNKIPDKLTEAFTNAKTLPNDIQGRVVVNNYRQQEEQKEPYLTLVYGFQDAFSDRNNWHVSVDDQYKRIAQMPQLDNTLKAMDAAFTQAGITDTSSSDLKQMCLELNEMRTTAYEIYGPKAAIPSPSEFKAMSDSLDKVLVWRLVNMYGLDDATAQNVAQAVGRIPVRGFSAGGLQPPAYIQ